MKLSTPHNLIKEHNLPVTFKDILSYWSVILFPCKNLM